MAVAFRFDISAINTMLMAFYSKQKKVFGGVTWAATKINEEDAKILSIWFNSSLNILQLIMERYPTRGAWPEIHKYIYEQIMVINPSKLSNPEKKGLLKLFGEVKKIKFQPLWKQLTMNCSINDFNS